MEKKVGRPSRYEPRFCDEIIEFFDVEPTKTIIKKIITKKGDVIELEEEVANYLPTVERFALNLRVHKDTLYEWAKVHPEFSDALRIAQQCQKEILTQNGLRKLYDRTFAKFMAVNLTDLRDKQEITVKKEEDLSSLTDEDLAKLTQNDN